MSYVKMCKCCVKKTEDDLHNGYYPFIGGDICICPICQCKLIDTILTRDEYLTIEKISNNPSFIEAMIKLKQDDIVEYQLKMSQFKTQAQQQKQINEQQKSNNQPHCPHCKSANIKPISALNRGTSIVMLGIFSKKINKSFECKQCGYTW